MPDWLLGTQSLLILLIDFYPYHFPQCQVAAADVAAEEGEEAQGDLRLGL